MTSTGSGPAHSRDLSGVQDRLIQAAERSVAAGETWTAPRDRVYRLLLEADAPLGAYDLIDRLSRPGQPVGPSTVYRALEFLLRLRLVHRIESRNAFVACAHPSEPHQAQFAICDRCGRAEEFLAEGLDLGAAAKAEGFAIRLVIAEARGLCPGCR